MDKIAIVHFHPLEKYPPVMNVINSISELENTNCIIYTTKNIGNKNWFSVDIIQINRVGAIKNNFISRYWCYLKFNLITIFSLLIKRPNVVVAYETFSLFPIFFYKKLFLKTKVYVHYHEYISPEEITNSSLYFKGLHALEKKLFMTCKSISHTNEDRMQLFLKEYPFINPSKGIITPNLPPSNWYEYSKSNKKENTTGITRLVHVGALSLETMYVEKVVKWVIAQRGLFTLDFYTDNCTESARKYISGLNSNHIQLLDGIHYYELPKVLITYDIGLTLYNGHIPNYVYNVPNKVLEYLACGLGVWYSNELISTQKFISENKILGCKSIDFTLVDALQTNSFEKLRIFNTNVSFETLLHAPNELVIKLTGLK